ncbi:MAG: VPLPA-CTERM sorting domain-containing protein [Pseudomonadota bacterium]
MTIKKTVLSAAVATVMGVAAAPQAAMADVISMDWSGVFTMLDPAGAALENTSLAKGTNRFQTAVTGTMQFDTATGYGTATLVPFDFFSGSSPAEAVGIEMQAIGDGMGGPGSLILGNMLFNWNGNNGIPVSIVLDAAGMFGAMMDPGFGVGTVISGVGAIPAADGTYTNASWGYLGLGPTPVATTEWNTSFAPGCSLGSCMGVTPSGALPLVTDTAVNSNEYAMGDGVGVGGNPMADGPFQGYNANFDITSITITDITTIPVPAAAWLFGSGLLGLVGVARRRKA